jgi:phytol kinase
MMSVALGDGLGEFIGKPYGKHKFKITANKSVEGSIAVFFGSFIGAILTLFLFNMFTVQIFLWVILTSFVAMVIEAVSFSFLDNVLMPTSVAAILWFAI